MKRTILSIILCLAPFAFCAAETIDITHTGYSIRFDTERNTAVWSAWMLTPDRVYGDVPRCDTFYPDPLVPYEHRVVHGDYTGSGFDRGHLCPAADMAWSEESMHDSFCMSNICPQDPTLNRVHWKALESACRRWACRADTLYIVAGPVYASETPERIGRAHPVDVPDAFFKVVLSVRNGCRKAIGFLYLNVPEEQTMTSACVPVDSVETITGLDFFRWLDDDEEERLESRCCLAEWENTGRSVNNFKKFNSTEHDKGYPLLHNQR